MQLLHTAAAVRTATAGKKTVLVPTMGGLHAGHLALVEYARTLADTVIVSIYVNPLQFAPNEDLDSYPRRLQADCEQLRPLADIVYAPSDSEMYPQPQDVRIALPPVADTLCGKSRPGFFQGVAVVVCKLFNQCRPDIAVFGQKDFQQALIVNMMTTQLNMGIKIFTHPTVRAEDGLALSSRNDYLSHEERQQAPALYAALRQAAARLQNGEQDYNTICNDGIQQLQAAGMKEDYFAIRAAADLGTPAADTARVVLAAAWLGRARLIDNLTVAADGTIL